MQKKSKQKELWPILKFFITLFYEQNEVNNPLLKKMYLLYTNTFGELLRTKKGNLYQINGMEDHIHHQKEDTQNELKRLWKENGMEPDERYFTLGD